MKGKSVTMVMMVVFVALSLMMSGCGGGGGGGSTAVTPGTPATGGSVTLLAKTAEPGAPEWGTDTISVSAGNTVLIHTKITNGISSMVYPSAVVTIPSEVSFVAGSGQALYGSNQLITITDSIAAGATSLGFSLEAGSYAFLDFDIKVASNATAGVKTVTITVNDVPATITINVMIEGGSACPVVTNPVCNTGYHLVAGANNSAGCPTAGTCVQDACSVVTNPTCNVGSHLVAGPVVNGCATVGTCVQNACSAVTNPTCGTGYTLVPSPNDSNGCAMAGTCVVAPPVPVAQTGSLTLMSNVRVANMCITKGGVQLQCYSFETNEFSNGTYSHIFTGQAAGDYIVSTLGANACPSVPNKGVDSGQTISSATLSGNGSATLKCWYIDPTGPSGPVLW